MIRRLHCKTISCTSTHTFKETKSKESEEILKKDKDINRRESEVLFPKFIYLSLELAYLIIKSHADS